MPGHTSQRRPAVHGSLPGGSACWFCPGRSGSRPPRPVLATATLAVVSCAGRHAGREPASPGREPARGAADASRAGQPAPAGSRFEEELGMAVREARGLRSSLDASRASTIASVTRPATPCSPPGSRPAPGDGDGARAYRLGGDEFSCSARGSPTWRRSSAASAHAARSAVITTRSPPRREGALPRRAHVRPGAERRGRSPVRGQGRTALAPGTGRLAQRANAARSFARSMKNSRNRPTSTASRSSSSASSTRSPLRNTPLRLRSSRMRAPSSSR